jgi:hypothetical protein
MADRVYNFRTGERQRARIGDAASCLRISNSAFIRAAVNNYLRTLQDQDLLPSIDRNATARY